MPENWRLKTDEELVEWFRIAPGERQGIFRLLYERHAGALCGFLRRTAGNPDTADDLTQETFLRALNGLESFSGESTFKTWLYTIGANLFRDQLRRKRPVADVNAIGDKRATADPSPDQQVGTRETVRQVQAAVNSLPEDLRQPLALVRFEGMKYREAAAVLGITVDAVRMRVHRAHMALVGKLRPLSE